MVVGFTTTCAIGAYHQLNHAHSEMYLIQRYVIEFVRDLWQVGGFLQIFEFIITPPINSPAQYN
jgi:hypothetical protein